MKPSTNTALRDGQIRIAGVHLSGSNAHKTSLVILAVPASLGNASSSFTLSKSKAQPALSTPASRSLYLGLKGQPRSSQPVPNPFPLRIVKVYEKIGSFGSVFSDERLADILLHEGPFAEVFVDSPLTAPPCVECQRPHCPSVMKCEDIGVAYMMALASQQKRRGVHRIRPLNPQSQRLWDVLQTFSVDKFEKKSRQEPSYSANLAPLVARGKTLQRRLNAAIPGLELKETQVAQALEVLMSDLNIPGLTGEKASKQYRSFELGLQTRAAIVDHLIATTALDVLGSAEAAAGSEGLIESVETFNAFVCAWVGAAHVAGLTVERPDSIPAGQGWVFLPDRNAGQSSDYSD